MEKALSEIPKISHFSVTKTELTLTTTLSYEEIAENITQLGYSIPEPELITLYLAGLKCGKCINKTTDTLSTLSHTSIESISKDKITLNTVHSQESIIELIESIGFQASSAPFIPDSPLPKEEVITLNKETPTDQSKTEKQKIEKTTQLILSGMTCASCVASVEKIISAVANVQSVSVNLAERTALIYGDINAPELIKAIEKGGYGAEISLSEEQRRKSQKEQYLKTTVAHKRNTIMSLAIGAPLMLWGYLVATCK
nr:cation transporter [Aliivibrio salmonicida]